MIGVESPTGLHLLASFLPCCPSTGVVSQPETSPAGVISPLRFILKKTAKIRVWWRDVSLKRVQTGNRENAWHLFSHLLIPTDMELHLRIVQSHTHTHTLLFRLFSSRSHFLCSQLYSPFFVSEQKWNKLMTSINRWLRKCVWLRVRVCVYVFHSESHQTDGSGSTMTAPLISHSLK